MGVKKKGHLCAGAFFFGNMFSTQFFLTETDFESSILENVFKKKTSSNLLESNDSSKKNSSGDISLFGCRS